MVNCIHQSLEKRLDDKVEANALTVNGQQRFVEQLHTCRCSKWTSFMLALCFTVLFVLKQINTKKSKSNKSNKSNKAIQFVAAKFQCGLWLLWEPTSLQCKSTHTSESFSTTSLVTWANYMYSKCSQTTPCLKVNGSFIDAKTSFLRRHSLCSNHTKG